MARTVASLPAGSRITDYISLGVIAKFFPLAKVRGILQKTQRASIRERDLPAHVVVYYVIALALYMRSSYREVLRCLLEGVQWLLDPSDGGSGKRGQNGREKGASSVVTRWMIVGAAGLVGLDGPSFRGTGFPVLSLSQRGRTCL
jgi:hypothetical protein